MKRLVIIGSGTGGTMVAAKIRKRLDESEWKIIIIDKDEKLYYPPGYVFIPFGIYTENDCVKPKREFIPKGVDFIQDEVVGVNPDNRIVKGKKGVYNYEWLVIATGCRIMPQEVEGMMDDWRINIYDFYTPDGATKLYQKLKHFHSGRIVVNIAEMPIRCYVAPLEFLFMADWFFTIKGIRRKIEIEFVSPLISMITKPATAKAFKRVVEKKNIKFTGSFDIARVNAEGKCIESYGGDKINYDLLVSIPPNLGAQFIEHSGMGDPMCYIDTDLYTLKAKNFGNIFIIGDATNLPIPKAGSVAHYESDTVVENIMREINGYEARPSYDGHATCFICSGYKKALLIDSNYMVEPRPGMFPFPVLGPFTLLGESYFNYYAKRIFKWVYWNLLLKGKKFPLENRMQTAHNIPKDNSLL